MTTRFFLHSREYGIFVTLSAGNTTFLKGHLFNSLRDNGRRDVDRLSCLKNRTVPFSCPLTKELAVIYLR